jgi:hypothetical protein
MSKHPNPEENGNECENIRVSFTNTNVVLNFEANVGYGNQYICIQIKLCLPILVIPAQDANYPI